MTDPLAQVIQLLRPRAVFSKGITGLGSWTVRYQEFGLPGFCAMTEGRCRLAVDGEEPVFLEAGDFVLLPATPAFTMSSVDAAHSLRIQPVDPKAASAQNREIRYGRTEGPPDMRQFGGYFSFGAPDAGLLVSLLPRMIRISGAPRLTSLVQLVGEEAAREDIGRDLILERLVEILLIEALRAAPAQQAEPGLLRGLADPRIAAALRLLHGDVERAWTIPELANAAGMSRSAFFDRFVRLVGARPMEYLVAWRMTIAKDLLRGKTMALDEVAGRIGYSSSSTFSTAFSRHVGVPPGQFMRQSGVWDEAGRAARA
ncbi:MAG: AraC family transcriptional regulator [Hoeflea sp.]|uniref:AraC family transcriptional regulator n=1 Tax=Hoeflea sp. TaxID=1940281 RepID=UPI001D8AD76E|nr:AraC family transcriptional regulator [Hoeflea sp.]MBU4531455.1 AraC family transcriptional regulator [Alphaproteobacteria bacterium]MBU4544312.1 AraC family transcriptional regulator [Alphaproteobacteria bacterium]MBU4550451.1 AraC family transcriptional regulator [Alphaproteobacteria bacterium]MBV1724731.1 AraC family transcriptional regulator [Hoeflea sp.]MBV1760751.1 AraC family transcriptional regulator [Hoeflea sp.]